MARANSLGEAIYNLFSSMSRKGKKLTCGTALWIGLNFFFCPSDKDSLMSEHGISKSYLYELRTRARAFLDSIEALEDMGGSFLLMDSDFITRMILLLHCEGKNSTYQIQNILREGMKVDISIGKISEIINTYAHKAIKVNEEMDKRCFPKIRDAAMDEIYIGRTPILTGLDLVSTYVVLISPQRDRTLETWKTALSILHDLGLSPDTIITDACGSLLSSLTECFGEGNVSQLDVFHALKSLHDAYYQVKRKLSKPITEAADIEEKAKTRSPQERTLKRYIELVDEVIPENQNLIDQMDTIIQWIGELIAFPGYSIEDSVSLINWCLDMLLVLAKDYSKLRAEIHKFREKIDTTLAYLHKFYGYMEREAQKQDVPYELLTQVYYLRRFDASSREYSEGWARLHAAYGYDNALLGKAFTIVETLCRTTKRASSLVENLNSRIRPFLNDKRGMTDYHAQLMRMFLNYRKYPRSRLDFRKGKSPIEILLGTEENFDFFEALGISAPKIITV